MHNAVLGCIVRQQIRIKATRRGTAAVVAAAVLSGCGLTLRTDIHDPDPAAKIPALVQASEDPTAEELRAMVRALGHDDVAVRLFAIESLESATGETRGFRPYDPPERRAEAVERWQAWLTAQDGGSGVGGSVQTAKRGTQAQEATHGGGR